MIVVVSRNKALRGKGRRWGCLWPRNGTPPPHLGEAVRTDPKMQQRDTQASAACAAHATYTQAHRRQRTTFLYYSLAH